MDERELPGRRHDDRAALTFDDGPSEWTEPILDELVRHGATATFFVLGCAVDGREAILERVASAGCEVGLHGWSHRRLTGIADDEIRDEMSRTSARVEAVTGQVPRLWRAPYLDADARVRKVCSELGLSEVWCDVFTEDYMRETDEIVERTAAGLRAGSVVLLHDGRAPQDTPADSSVTRTATVRAVPAILADAGRLGVRLVNVSALAEIGPPAVRTAATATLRGSAPDSRPPR